VNDVSESDDTLLLKAAAAELIEQIWKAEFYNDVENYIMYKDPKKKKNPRPEREIEQILSELDRLKNDLIDEIVEEMHEKNIIKFEDIIQSYEAVRKICHECFANYRRRLWDVVKPELPAK